jgi:hypothetical protein
LNSAEAEDGTLFGVLVCVFATGVVKCALVTGVLEWATCFERSITVSAPASPLAAPPLLAPFSPPPAATVAECGEWWPGIATPEGDDNDGDEVKEDDNDDDASPPLEAGKKTDMGAVGAGDDNDAEESR